jgi:riboflavin synthase alpha subunit
MRKIAIVLLALAFVSPAIFAQTATPEKKTAAEKASTFAGKVVDVTVADPVKGVTAGAVTVADETGKTTTFTVKATAKILAHTLDVVTLNKLKVGDRVKIETTSANDAQSIKVVR